jgi:hypothetical protein
VIQRRKYLARSTKPIARKTRVKRENPERKKRRKLLRDRKHGAYMRSPMRKIVDLRAAGRCEAALLVTDASVTVRDVNYAYMTGPPAFVYRRCPNTERLSHHHRTYARYGGKELPEDMLKVCKRCHECLDAIRFLRERRKAG